MRTQKQQQHLFRFWLVYAFSSRYTFNQSLRESESKLLVRFFAVLFSTASYPGPDASSLVAASADALCLVTSPFFLALYYVKRPPSMNLWFPQERALRTKVERLLTGNNREGIDKDHLGYWQKEDVFPA